MADVYVLGIVGILVFITSFAIGAISAVQQTVQYLGFVISAILVSSSCILARIHSSSKEIEDAINDQLIFSSLYYKNKLSEQIKVDFSNATYVVTVYALLRNEPQKKAETIEKLFVGTPVRLLKIGDKVKINGIETKWCNVELKDGKQGWCIFEYIQKL